MALIRELLNDKDTMSRLNDNERQTLMQLSQCHHEDFASPRKRFVGLIYWLLWLPFFNLHALMSLYILWRSTPTLASLLRESEISLWACKKL